MSVKRWSLVVVSATVATASGCAPSPAPSTPEYTAADSAAVQASVEKWRSSVVARDFDAWGTTVTAGVVLYPPNTRPIQGREAAVDYIRNYPVITKFDIVVDELVGHADVAYDRGTYMLALTLPDGSAAADTGSFVSIFRRQADSTWAHDRVIWNSRLPVPTPSAAPARR